MFIFFLKDFCSFLNLYFCRQQDRHKDSSYSSSWSQFHTLFKCKDPLGILSYGTDNLLRENLTQSSKTCVNRSATAKKQIYIMSWRKNSMKLFKPYFGMRSWVLTLITTWSICGESKNFIRAASFPSGQGSRLRPILFPESLATQHRIKCLISLEEFQLRSPTLVGNTYRKYLEQFQFKPKVFFSRWTMGFPEWMATINSHYDRISIQFRTRNCP